MHKWLLVGSMNKPLCTGDYLRYDGLLSLAKAQPFHSIIPFYAHNWLSQNHQHSVRTFQEGHYGTGPPPPLGTRLTLQL